MPPRSLSNRQVWASLPPDTCQQVVTLLTELLQRQLCPAPARAQIARPASAQSRSRRWSARCIAAVGSVTETNDALFAPTAHCHFARCAACIGRKPDLVVRIGHPDLGPAQFASELHQRIPGQYLRDPGADGRQADDRASVGGCLGTAIPDGVAVSSPAGSDVSRRRAVHRGRCCLHLGAPEYTGRKPRTLGSGDNDAGGGCRE